MSTCCDSPSQVLPALLAISSPLPSHEAWPHRAHLPSLSKALLPLQLRTVLHRISRDSSKLRRLNLALKSLVPWPLPAPSPSLGFFPASLRRGSSPSLPAHFTPHLSDGTPLRLSPRFASILVPKLRVGLWLLHAIHYPATRGRCLKRDSDYGAPCLQSVWLPAP